MKRFLALGIVALLVVIALPVPATAQIACDITVTAPSSIQTAVDTVTDVNFDGKRVVCLDDSGGDFSQTVVFGPEDSGITLTAEPGDSPTLDGGNAALNAINFLDGVSDVTIEGLTIQNYGSSPWTQPGNAIQAWDVSTSNITIRNNIMANFSWNAVLVGSEGGFVHDNWMVKNNTVTNATFIGIELTNSEDSTIMKNDVDGGFIGIAVQARSTSTTGVGSYNIAIDGVHVLHNTVDNASYAGIYVLSFTGHPTNFTPITGASSLLSSVNVSHNTVTDSGTVAILFWAFNDAATAKNGRIIKDVLNCPSSTTPGIMILERGLSGQKGTVENVKVVNNTFDDDCDPQVTDEGEDTKLPPGPPSP
jgi:parallel beta-helix repeat protein